MAADRGHAILNRLLPVLRLLGVKSVSMDCEEISGEEVLLAAPWCESVPPKAWPEGLTTLIQLAGQRLLHQMRAELDRYSTLIIDVVGSAWLVEFEDRESEPYPLAGEEPPPPNAHDLATFVKGVCRDRDGHLVLADRLEELLGPCAAAAALRASEADPPGCDPSQSLFGDPLVWRWLDRGVMLYLSRVYRWTGYPPPEHAGFAVGLLHRRQGERARRWQRWLPGEPPEAKQLASELGSSRGLSPEATSGRARPADGSAGAAPSARPAPCS
jgi:hypothetical protein